MAKKPITIYGTESADSLDGTGGDDTIYSYGGGDIIHGRGGADFIQAGSGDDQVYGDEGDDRMVDGGQGNDLVRGGLGNDTVAGGEGNDAVYGDEGNDRVIGHTGDDFLHGGDGNDTIIGEWGRDELWGGAGADVFQYGWGADSTTRTDWYPPDGEITYGVDSIMDFESGLDRIDLSRIDADLTTPILAPRGKSSQPTGNDAFVIVNEVTDAANAAGKLTLAFDGVGTTVNGYMDNDLTPDFTLYVKGSIAPADFIL